MFELKLNENDPNNIIEAVKNNLFDIGLILGIDETLKKALTEESLWKYYCSQV